jgi:hypothetical protein
MRILNILSGVAVLLTTLAFGHLLHHYYLHAGAETVHDAGFLGGMSVGVAVLVLSFVGGCLLLRRGR